MRRRSWLNEPPMYLMTRKGEFVRLIAWPDDNGKTRWVREDPQPVKAFEKFDYSAAELAAMNALWEDIKKMRRVPKEQK